MTIEFYIAHGLKLKCGKISWVEHNRIANNSTLFVHELVDSIIDMMVNIDDKLVNKLVSKLSYYSKKHKYDSKQPQEPFGKIITDAWNLFDDNALHIIDEYGKLHTLLDILKRCYVSDDNIIDVNITDIMIYLANINNFRSYDYN